MVKGTSYYRSVRIVILVALTVIHKEGGNVTVESAVNEYVISAVVDTAVAVFNTENVRKLVIFTEIRNVYACSTAKNVTVGYGK